MVILSKNKVLLAIANKDLEAYIKKQLKNEFIFVGEATYKEAIIRSIKQNNPQIIVMLEGLAGRDDIYSITYQIRKDYPNLRIVFIAGRKGPGDESLTSLVSSGIYDILYGGDVEADKIINLIKTPNTYADVSEFHHINPVFKHDIDETVFEVRRTKPETPDIVTHELDNNPLEVSIKDRIIGKVKKEKKQEAEVKTEERTEVVIEKSEVSEVIEDENEDKIELEIEEVDEKKPKRSIFKTIDIKEREKTYKEKIISFIGGKSGVGTTTIAFNTAVSIANQGNKVIYIELDDKTPNTSYVYNIDHISNGIDTCLGNIKDREYSKINNSIIKTRDLIKKKDSMREHKKLPKTLDFLFFSKSYIANIKDKENIDNFKELFLYIKYQLGYDYVIIDISMPIDTIAVKDSLMYSDNIVSIISQDITSIGYHLYELKSLSDEGLNMNDKMIHVINKYVPAKFGAKEIKDWLEIDDVSIVSINSKDLIEYNYKGIPLVLGSGRNTFKKEILNILTKIK